MPVSVWRSIKLALTESKIVLRFSLTGLFTGNTTATLLQQTNTSYRYVNVKWRDGEISYSSNYEVGEFLELIDTMMSEQQMVAREVRAASLAP